jgi:hypothetical protein
MSVSVLLAIAVSAVQAQPQAPPPKITMVSVEGCVSGTTLKSARPATIEEAELIVSPTYKMTGSKAIKEELKKVNGMLVRVRAELPDPPSSAGPAAKVGNTTIQLGTDESVAQVNRRMPEPPSLDVQSVESLGRKCDANSK